MNLAGCKLGLSHPPIPLLPNPPNPLTIFKLIKDEMSERAAKIAFTQSGLKPSDI